MDKNVKLEYSYISGKMWDAKWCDYLENVKWCGPLENRQGISIKPKYRFVMMTISFLSI